MEFEGSLLFTGLVTGSYTDLVEITPHHYALFHYFFLSCYHFIYSSISKVNFSLHVSRLQIFIHFTSPPCLLQVPPITFSLVWSP